MINGKGKSTQSVKQVKVRNSFENCEPFESGRDRREEGTRRTRNSKTRKERPRNEVDERMPACKTNPASWLFALYLRGECTHSVISEFLPECCINQSHVYQYSVLSIIIVIIIIAIK